jgi:hypothetical protein
MFPVLKNPVILQIMQEVNVPLSESELTEPGRCKERVREVFVQLVSVPGRRRVEPLLARVLSASVRAYLSSSSRNRRPRRPPPSPLSLPTPNRTSSSLSPPTIRNTKLAICWGLDQPSLFALPSRIVDRQSRLSHPDLFNDALPEAKFFCLLSRQLRICGYHEFGFKDLAAPQAKRFRRQLSALINFLKYREDMGYLEMQALDEVSSVLFWMRPADVRFFMSSLSDTISVSTFYPLFRFFVRRQREELFAALDEVTENHMTLKGQLDEARAINRERVMEREEAEAECKEVSYILRR